MRKLLSSKNIKQFLSYFGVGGAAAIVEWVSFSIFVSALGFPYLLATVIAFILATTANWILGRMFTFKESAYKEKRLKEVGLVFLVSAIGLGFNMLLMYLFVDIIGMNTNIQQTIAKVIATGIVFIWNFLSRKLWIYKERDIDFRNTGNDHKRNNSR